MKKTVIVEILLVFVLAILLMWTALNIQYICNEVMMIDYYKTNFPDHIEFIELIELQKTWVVYHIVELVFTSIALCADIAAIIIIAVKPLPGINPLVEKYQTWSAAHKQAAKAKRIAELENELDELKKDG